MRRLADIQLFGCREMETASGPCISILISTKSKKAVQVNILRILWKEVHGRKQT